MAGISLLDLGKPLQLPDPVRPQTVDFSPLDKIGEAIGQARIRGQVADVIAQNTDPGGKLDFEKAGAALGAQGLTEAGRPFLELAMRKTALQQSAAQAGASLAEQRRLHDMTAAHQAASLDLQKQQNAQTIDPELQRTLAEAKRPPEFHTLSPGQLAIDSKGNKIAENGSGIISDAAAKIAADQLEQGDDSALKGYGRGAQGPENINKIREMLVARGVTGDALARANAEYAGVKAANRASGTSEAKMTAASIEASGAIKLGMESVDKVGASRFVPWNKLAQMAESNISDPALAEFKAANNAIINTYTRAINPTGVSTVDSQKHAHDMLSTAMGPGAWKAAVAQMQREIDMAVNSPAQAREHLNKIFQERRNKANGTTPATTTPGQKTEAAPAAPSKEAIDRARSNPVATYREAQDLIAKGANKDQIRSLLLGADLDPSKIGL